MVDNNLKREIIEIVEKVNYVKYNDAKGILNERYLHHYFSRQYQQKHAGSLDLTVEQIEDMQLHPEWPTWKKARGKDNYGRYRREKDKKYYPAEKDYKEGEGQAGFIDFVIGSYSKPKVGIEFMLRYGWCKEEIIFDFMKLLDKRNPFEFTISVNTIFHKGEQNKEKMGKLVTCAYNQAVERLEKHFDINENPKKIFFIVTEISATGRKKFWAIEEKKKRLEEADIKK
jgi:hypothetical protein